MFSTLDRMIFELESQMFGATASNPTCHPTWFTWYQLTDFEIDNWNDISDIEVERLI